MPPLPSRATRELVKKRNVIEGPKSLHRGIHYNLNEEVARSYKANPTAKRADPRELLVHHQRIQEALQDVYARTAALHAADAPMADRIEERWRQFERVGGRRPPPPPARPAALCVSPSAVPYAERLAEGAAARRALRARADWERATRGEAVDYRDGSALHAAKDRRVRQFQRRQLRRAHVLRRVGDPTPLGQAGRYDLATGTLRVFQKTRRQVEREGAREERVAAVHPRRSGARSQWAIAEMGNLNRPEQQVVREAREGQVGPPPRRRNRPGVGKKRSRSS